MSYGVCVCIDVYIDFLRETPRLSHRRNELRISRRAIKSLFYHPKLSCGFLLLLHLSHSLIRLNSKPVLLYTAPRLSCLVPAQIEHEEKIFHFSNAHVACTLETTLEHGREMQRMHFTVKKSFFLFFLRLVQSVLLRFHLLVGHIRVFSLVFT